MAIITKKGFVFSLLAIFISFLLFAIALSQFDRNDYTKEIAFTETRIISINDEITYFKEVYLPNSVSFALFNTVNQLISFSNTNYTLTNHSVLNQLIKEGIMNGSFYNINQPILDDRTITYFVNNYTGNFNDSYLANITVEIDEINVFEDQPYHLTLQYNVSYFITTQDNLSTWNFTDFDEVEVPLYNLQDPQFLYKDGQTISIRPSSLFTASIDWDETSFNETIQNTYSTVFFNPTIKYTLGSSFLDRMFNTTESNYLNVSGFWSFDYDEEEFGIYDNIGYNQDGALYGNTRLHLSFDNETIEGTTLFDNYSYSNIGSISGAIAVNDSCMIDTCLLFDGVDDEVVFTDAAHLDIGNSSAWSIFAWINSSDNVSEQHLISKGGNNTDPGYIVGLNGNFSTNEHLFATINNGSANFTCFVEHNFSIGSFVQLGVVFDRLSNNITLYRNAEYLISCDSGGIDNTTSIDTASNLFISDATFPFSGIIDELNIYSKNISLAQLVPMYNDGKAKRIDYGEALFDTGISFDGIDDYATIGQGAFQSDYSEFALEIWFYVDNLSEGTLFESTNGATNHLSLSFNSGNDIVFETDMSSGSDVDTVSSADILNESWNYILVQLNSGNKEVYVNNRLSSSLAVAGTLDSTTGNITLGASENSGTYDNYFEGILDEIKLYNVSLTRDQIDKHYFNFDGASKGCCNYLTLINPTDLGYNSASYEENVSYSSSHFYDFFLDGVYRNISLYNLTNFTSTSTTQNYYNFRVDVCLLQAYSIFDYSLDPDPEVYKAVDDTNSCEELIRLGYY